MSTAIKRVYDRPEEEDGFRVLVDRLWPRGISKQKARIDIWIKEIAPSSQLRKWFAHDPEKWDEFRDRYFKELGLKGDLVESVKSYARRGKITLLFSATDEEHNNAAALRDLLDSPPKGQWRFEKPL